MTGIGSWGPRKTWLLAVLLLLQLTAGAVQSDAERNDSQEMNCASDVSNVRRVAEGGVKVLFIGNSITLHPILPSVGWTNLWGMAASAEEKDYVHLVTAGIERETGRKADLWVRNLVDFERGFEKYDLRQIDDLVAFRPDYLVVALGENVRPLVTEQDKLAYRTAFKNLLARFTYGRMKPNVVVKGAFWPNPGRDELMAHAASDLAMPFVATPCTNDSLKAKGLFAHAGVEAHPSDRGMAYMAEKVLEGFFPKESGFAVTVDGRPVAVRPIRVSRQPFNQWAPGYQRPVDQTEVAGLLRFETDGASVLCVKPLRDFKEAKVRPLSAKVVCSVKDGSVVFTLPKPGNYVLELDGWNRPLEIFAQPRRDFAAERKTANVVFGPGRHEPVVVKLKSHDRVYIDRDAVVLGSFQADGVEDVRVSGYGIICGSRNRRVGNNCYREGMDGAVRIIDSKDVVFDGPTVLDSSCWCVAAFNSRDITIKNLKVTGAWRYNTDGIDICNSQHVRVHDCYVHSFDDTLVVKGNPSWDGAKTPYDPVEDVRFERCVCWCGWGLTLEIGLETWAPRFRDVVFEDCDLIHNDDAALGVSVGGPDKVEDIVFRNIRIEYDRHDVARHLQTNRNHKIECAEPKTGTWFAAGNLGWALVKDRNGNLDRITVENIELLVDDGVKPPTKRIEAASGTKLGRIDFRNVRVNGRADPVLYLGGEKCEMFTKAFALMREAMLTKPVNGFTAPFFPPGSGYGENWWQLDSATVLEAWKWCDFDLSARSVENFCDVQRPDGRIPLWGNDVLPRGPHHSRQYHGVSSLPVLFKTAHSLAMMRGDRAFTEKMYRLCSRYCDWWRTNRVDRATGLVSSVFEETFPPYLGAKGEYAGVDTGVMVALGAEWTAELADRLGERESAEDLRAFSRTTFDALRTRTWDAKTGLFRPYGFADGSQGFESAEGFYMFADRNLGVKRRTALLASLTGPRFAWGKMPVASMAIDSPFYTNTVGRSYQFNASWSGNVWSLINRWTVHGLLRAGCEKEAVELALATKRMIDWAGTFDEFYHTGDGSPQGGEKYLWTAADYVILTVEDLLGISFDGRTQELCVRPRITGDFRLENLSLPGGVFATVERRNGKIAVTRRRAADDAITVTRNDVFGRKIPSFVEAKPVWAKGRECEQNLSLRFVASVGLTGREKGIVVRSTGCSVYRLRVNGVFAGYGPARGPKGSDRVDEWDVGRFVHAGKNDIEIDVAGYNVPNYYLPDQPSYLRAELVADGRVLAATGTDAFRARVLNRVQKVPRYSFQRPFCEVWNASAPVVGEPLELAVQPFKSLLPRRAAYPDFLVNDRAKKLSEGRARYDVKASVRNYWPLDVTGPTLAARGFPTNECAIIPSHEAERYGDDIKGAVKTSVWDFGLLDCGFVGVSAKAHGKGRVLVVFDEVLTNGKVDFLRGGTANVVIWNIDGAGVFSLESFEPYAFRYAKFIADGDIELDAPYIRTFKSPSADGFACPTADLELKRIFEAARETFKQNAVDVFTDCPGRERAGWLCDSFFTARVSKLLTGSLALEELFLENYLLAECPDIPKGMFPMCYPADHVNKNFIPNWAMWLVLELEEYLGRGGDPMFVKRFEPKVLSLVDYLRTFENDDGLLENLPAWVFVEWSECNSLTKGVNYPSNMTWARVLEAVATLYGRDDLRAKAEKVRETVRRQSFDGTWFRDQALRSGDGQLLVQTNHTETCQYYAFYFGTATVASHPKLWKMLVDDFGPARKVKNGHPDVPFSNAFIGNYLRLELLRSAGLDKAVEANVRGYFLPMAEKTGTLWEHDLPTASCCHGFASHIAIVLAGMKEKLK